MASVYELQWQQQKENAETDIAALMKLGLSLDTARRLAGWNETLDYDNYAQVTSLAWPPQPSPPVPANGLRKYLTLEFSRAESRSNPENLKEAVLDAGVLYSVFVPDIPELQITQMQFSLDGSPVHTEYMKPWDYAGTTGTGGSTRVTFIAGSHNIEVSVVDIDGLYLFDASFEVE